MIYKHPKILLISIPDYNDSRISEPLGLGYLSAYLRNAGYSVDIFDPKIKNPKPISTDNIVCSVVEKKYDVIGAALYTVMFAKTMGILKRIKELRPDARIVLGGHHITFTHEPLLKKFSFIDIAIRGEGEKTFLEVADRLKDNEPLDMVEGVTYRDGSRIIANPPRGVIDDLDAIPFPTRNRAYFAREDAKKRPAALITSRGCPYRCSFCSISAFYKSQPGKKYRMRSPQNIADEIIEIVRSFNITHINLMDDNSFVYPERLLEVTDILMRKGINLKYTLVSRPDQIVRHRKYIPILKKRGFYHVEMGIESGSQAQLNRFSKDLKVKESEEAIAILRENKMSMLLDFIMFDPDMTIDQLKTNVKFIKSLGSSTLFNKEIDMADVFGKLDLHPGTAYYEKMSQQSRIIGSKFNPNYLFKNKDMQTLNRFLMREDRLLNKILSGLNGTYLKNLFEISRRRSKQNNPIKQVIHIRNRAEVEIEFKKIHLKLFDYVLKFGSRLGFSKTAFSETKCAIKNDLKSLRDKINNMAKTDERTSPTGR